MWFEAGSNWPNCMKTVFLSRHSGRFSRWYTEHRGGPTITIHCVRGIQRALHNEVRVKMNELNLPNSASLIFHNWWPAPPPAPAIATQLWTVKTRTSPDFAKPLAAGAGPLVNYFFRPAQFGLRDWGFGFNIIHTNIIHLRYFPPVWPQLGRCAGAGAGWARDQHLGRGDYVHFGQICLG